MSNVYGPSSRWRKIIYEGLRELNWSPNIISMVRSGRIRLRGHVAYRGEQYFT